MFRQHASDLRTRPPTGESYTVRIHTAVRTGEVVSVRDPAYLVSLGLLRRSGEGSAEEGRDADGARVEAAEDEGMAVVGGCDFDAADLCGRGASVSCTLIERRV